MWGGAVNRQPGYRARNLQRRKLSPPDASEIDEKNALLILIEYEILRFLNSFSNFGPPLKTVPSRKSVSTDVESDRLTAETVVGCEALFQII